METLQIIYLILALVGGLFLVISIFGGDADADIDLDVGNVDFDISDAESPSESVTIFSLRTLATFLLGAGIAGWTSFNNGAPLGWQIFWGFFTGAIIAFLYYLVMRGLYSLQGSSTPTASELIGKQGIITIPTTTTGVAQVRISTKNGNVEFTCKEKDNKILKQNDTVKITSTKMGLGTLGVEKI
jgi:membrane protein implicated in regulation of membrane protease activity